ncbi:hypothetical protein [Staphylococcus devriesei]|nr:hypothetical protein [Staphylococcus devriesei]MCE5089191.1 hypothetical protein [Staphylococcus devriesei]MCE5096558.1 hypothetical protein [Staphylococcus devriesei]WKU13000.1 hypothetical protein Q2T90_09625 [Staphylococcus devriesei]SUM03885.1 Uncharacterised protein [Staphylococcus devriesei]
MQEDLLRINPNEMYLTIDYLLKQIQKNPDPQLIEATANLVNAYKNVTN